MSSVPRLEPNHHVTVFCNASQTPGFDNSLQYPLADQLHEKQLKQYHEDEDVLQKKRESWDLHMQ